MANADKQKPAKPDDPKPWARPVAKPTYIGGRPRIRLWILLEKLDKWLQRF